MKSLKMAIVISIVLAATTFAAPLNKAAVSGSATWVLHADYDIFVKTKVVQLVRAELAAQGIEQKLADFKTIFSFHPIDDIKNVTIYGKDKDPTKIAVIIQGAFDRSKLLSLVNMNPSYKASEYGAFTIHSWEDQKEGKIEPRFGSFFNDGTILMAGSQEAVVMGLDVLGGKGDTAVGKTLVGEAPKGAFLTIYAEKIGELVKNDQNAAVFQQAERFNLSLGEKDNRSFISAALVAKSKDEATTINQAIQGMLAFVKLATMEKMPKLTELANAVKVVAENESVGLHFEWDSAELISILKQAGEIKKQLDQAQQP